MSKGFCKWFCEACQKINYQGNCSKCGVHKINAYSPVRRCLVWSELDWDNIIIERANQLLRERELLAINHLTSEP